MGVGFRVTSVSTWVKQGSAIPPSLQVAALWGQHGRALVFGAFVLSPCRLLCRRLAVVPPSTWKGKRARAPGLRLRMFWSWEAGACGSGRRHRFCL